MTPRRLALILATTAVAAALAWALMTGLARFLRTPAPDASTPAPPSTEASPNASAAVPRIKATLYFVSEDGLQLVPAEQEVPLAASPVDQARSVLVAQLTAVAPAPLVSAIPEGTSLRSLFVSDRGEVFVDLDSTIRAKHPGGSMQELLTVYAIVDAVLTNLPTLQAVQILVDGREVDTLAGHVDLRRPLQKNVALIAAPPVSPPKP